MKASPITRGFQRKGPDHLDTERIPPGQHLTQDFPVLSAGPTPHVALDDWTLTLQFGNKIRASWTWNEFDALPKTSIRADIHCVTRWSKLDTIWQGVSVDDLLQAADIASEPGLFVMAHCDGGYTTNLSLADLTDGKAIVASHYDGQPLLPTHGGPARLLVPHLYLWKSAKWVRRLRFMEKDQPGFWESLGYHNHGDPWKEQRYAGD